jgi:hypothetical protein
MVAKDEQENNVLVPGLILSSDEEIRRYCNGIKQISLKKDKNQHEKAFDYKSETALESLK